MYTETKYCKPSENMKTHIRFKQHKIRLQNIKQMEPQHDDLMTVEQYTYKYTDIAFPDYKTKMFNCNMIASYGDQCPENDFFPVYIQNIDFLIRRLCQRSYYIVTNEI